MLREHVHGQPHFATRAPGSAPGELGSDIVGSCGRNSLAGEDAPLVNREPQTWHHDILLIRLSTSLQLQTGLDLHGLLDVSISDPSPQKRREQKKKRNEQVERPDEPDV